MEERDLEEYGQITIAMSHPVMRNWNDLETIICHQMKKDVDEKCKKLEFFRLAR